MFYWFMLAISILAEVSGAISIKYAGQEAGPLNYILLFTLVASSYYFLSKAIQEIPMGVAYAVWESIGLLVMLIAGILFFDERIYKEKLFACGIIVLGMVMLNKGHITVGQEGDQS